MLEVLYTFVSTMLKLKYGTSRIPQCVNDDERVREVLHGLRWTVRVGAARPLMPHDLPLWYTVYQ